MLSTASFGRDVKIFFYIIAVLGVISLIGMGIQALFELIVNLKAKAKNNSSGIIDNNLKKWYLEYLKGTIGIATLETSLKFIIAIIFIIAYVVYLLIRMILQSQSGKTASIFEFDIGLFITGGVAAILSFILREKFDEFKNLWRYKQTKKEESIVKSLNATLSDFEELENSEKRRLLSLITPLYKLTPGDVNPSNKTLGNPHAEIYHFSGGYLVDFFYNNYSIDKWHHESISIENLDDAKAKAKSLIASYLTYDQQNHDSREREGVPEILKKTTQVMPASLAETMNKKYLQNRQVIITQLIILLEEIRSKKSERIKVEVDRVTFDTSNNRFVLVLKDKVNSRELYVIVSKPHAHAIALQLEKIVAPVPLSHDLGINLLKTIKANLKEVIISELRENVYYSYIVLEHNGQYNEIDAGVSDAIALALRAQASIFVCREVMDMNSIPKK